MVIETELLKSTEDLMKEKRSTDDHARLRESSSHGGGGLGGREVSDKLSRLTS